MSYNLLIQASNPLGYWKLNGSGAPTIGTASATVTSATYSAPPLVANSGSAMVISKANAASVTIAHTYDAFFKNLENRTFQLEFWFSFNGNLIGNGYPGSLNTASQIYTGNILNIINIYDAKNSKQIGTIFYDYLRNTFRFRINGTGNTDAYYTVRNINTNFYISVSYYNKKIKINVNGDEGVSGAVVDTSVFPVKPSSSVIFQINSLGLNLVGQSFIISDLAFYNYLLNKDQQRKRIVYAYNADKPSAITTSLTTSLIDIRENDYHTFYNKTINGMLFKNQEYFSDNCIYHEDEGISYKRISSLEISDFTPSGSVTFSSTGASFSGSTALQSSEIISEIKNNINLTITAQISPTSTASSNILTIGNIVDDQYPIYVTASSNGFYVNYLNVVSLTSTQIAFIPQTLTTNGNYNFGMSLVNTNNIGYFYAASSNNSGSVTASVVIPNLDTKTMDAIFIGTNPYIQSTTNTLIKNVGINNLPQTNFLGYDFTDNKKFMARLTSDYSISQIATWITKIPVYQYNSDIVGSKIVWNSMDNMLAQVSSDMVTWTNINNSEPISILNNATPSNDIFLKLSIPYEYETEFYNQSFNHLQISLYGNLSFLSNDGNYVLSASSDSPSAQTYTIKEINEPILQRLNKFGISFYRNSSSIVNGYGIISPTSSAFTPYAIDFWIKIDSYPTASSVFIHGDPSNLKPLLYASANKLIFSSSATSKLYINGSAVTSNTFVASAGEYYHVLFDFGAAMSPSSSIFLNSSQPVAASTHSHGSYAFINLWNSTPTAANALARYNHFVANNIVSTSDIPVSLWQPNWNTDAINSVSAYKIG